MPLRIGFDLDGVFADMESELIRQAELIFGEAMTHKLQDRAEAAGPQVVPPSQTDDESTDATASASTQDSRTAAPDTLAGGLPPIVKLNMTSRQERRLWRHVAGIENFWQALNEIEPGIISRLAAVATERRWEIIFLTKRPQSAGLTAQRQTQLWLQSKGFELPSVYVVQGSRGKIAAALALDIVVDDRPENCLDVVADSKARAILVWRDEKTAIPTAARRLGIGVVRSVADCLDILTTVDSQPPSEGGVLDRVRRLLGLKEPANA